MHFKTLDITSIVDIKYHLEIRTNYENLNLINVTNKHRSFTEIIGANQIIWAQFIKKNQ